MSKLCEKCGRLLPAGALAFEVRIQVAADFDGVLPVDDESADLEARLTTLLREMEEADPERLMRDVYHVERHLVCPGCRDRYLANPLNLPLPEEMG
jgi:hypothetical protein